MILEKQKDNIVLEEQEASESIGMTLDMDSADFLMQMLSKNIYQDPIGSLVREYASNALDSHRKCGVDEPIIVSFGVVNSNYEFSVQDFGCGLSKEEFMAILSKYGKSTKRKSDKELGMYGVGAKSGLAYSSTIYFICRKDGKETKFMMYEGEDKNIIDVIHEKETSERNGVKVIVPVKYNDKYEFPKRIKEQLAYFEGVYFNVEGINNDFKILRSELYQWSALCNNYNLHICLDNVYYPIDFSKLGISVIPINIGLKFGLSDGIFPTLNRESIRYTQEAKEIILNKIKELSTHFMNKYNETITETDDIKSIFDYFTYNDRDLLLSKDPHVKIPTKYIQNYSTVPYKNPALKGIKKLDIERINTIKDYLTNEYEIKYTFSNKKFRGSVRNYKLDYRYIRNTPIYTFALELDRKKQNYLRETIGNTYCHFVRKERKIQLGKKTDTGYNNWIKLLELHKYPANQWRDLIKEAKYIQKLIEKDFIDADKIEIPKEWYEKKKAQKQTRSIGVVHKRQRLEGEIGGKMAFSLQRYVSGKNCKFENCNIELKTASKQPYVIVFGEDTEENRNKIQDYYLLVASKKIRFVVFSEREWKKAKDINLHNWMKLEVFLKGDNKLHKRIITSHAIKVLQEKYPHSFNTTVLLDISTELQEKVSQLKAYKLNNCYGELPDILKGKEEKYMDSKVLDIYKVVKNILEKLPFIEKLLKTMGYYGKDKYTYEVIRDLCKYHKFRIDWKHYKIKQKEDVVTEMV